VLKAARPAGASGAARPRPAGASGARPVAHTTAAKSPIKPAPPKEMTDEQKTIYALGLSMSQSLRQFALSPEELDLIRRALTDADAGKPAVDLSVWGPKIQSLANARAPMLLKREKDAAAAYIEKALQEPGAIKTASGLIYKELTSGTGASPTAADTVKVHYRGTLIDGTEFDSSYKRNEPAQFPLSNVIKGWTEGVQLMKVGGKSRLICPSDIAYGDQGRPPQIPGGATLIFEIELLDVSGK
jgi:FKBP-type peptidyl-prolyl cis-trans isomerase FkpA